MSWLKKKPKVNKPLRLWAAVAFGVMVVVNALANIVPINGVTSGGVSDSYPNLFAPAGYTFAIWSVIYLALGAYTLYQLGFFRAGKPTLDEGQLNAVSKNFLITSILNSAWIFAWHYKVIWLSVLLIGGMLVYLIFIADILRKQALTMREELLVRVPFNIYFGWITVATIANITTLLVSLEWDGWGRSDEFWTITLLVVGALIALVRMRHDRDFVYGLVFLWAFGGIMAKHVSETGWDGQYPGVIGALAGLLAVIALDVLSIIWSRMKPVVDRQ